MYLSYNGGTLKCLAPKTKVYGIFCGSQHGGGIWRCSGGAYSPKLIQNSPKLIYPAASRLGRQLTPSIDGQKNTSPYQNTITSPKLLPKTKTKYEI